MLILYVHIISWLLQVTYSELKKSAFGKPLASPINNVLDSTDPQELIIMFSNLCWISRENRYLLKMSPPIQFQRWPSRSCPSRPSGGWWVSCLPSLLFACFPCSANSHLFPPAFILAGGLLLIGCGWALLFCWLNLCLVRRPAAAEEEESPAAKVEAAAEEQGWPRNSSGVRQAEENSSSRAEEEEANGEGWVGWWAGKLRRKWMGQRNQAAGGFAQSENL